MPKLITDNLLDCTSSFSRFIERGWLRTMKKVSSILVEHLRKWGVRYAFGIPGKAVVPLLDEMEKQELTFILSRHECGGGFAASGYALQNLTLGIAVGTSGPGGTNLLTAAGQAKAYHLPVLFITGHPSMKDTGRALGQDSTFFGTDLVKLFEPLTLFSARIERSDLFPMYLRHALERALTGQRGPVHLSIPFDIFNEEIPDVEISLPTPLPLYSAHLEKVVKLLNKAEKPVLFIGKGVHICKAYEEILQLAELWKIPVMTTPGGKGTFPTHHSLSLGSFGLGGTESSDDYLRSGIDVMVVIGTKLSDMSLAGFSNEMYPKQVIQFDINPTFVGKSIHVPTVSIIGDARDNLQKLIQLARSTSFDYDQLSQPLFSPIRFSYPSNSPSDCMSAVEVMRTLRTGLPDETIMFGDDGSHTFYAIQHYDILKAGTFYFDDVFGTMGHAIGYSIGAKLAAPDKPIVCLTGDGCIMMHGMEISTAVCHQVAVIFVVLNNGRLDMVDKGMSVMVGKSMGTIYEKAINVSLFATSIGAKAYRIHNAIELQEALLEALEIQDAPTVIEVMVDPTEIPPILKRVLKQ
jgi:acetolactate synthase I/II/III large subunit